MAYIKDFSYSQPSMWVDAATIEQWTGSKPGFIADKIGNSKRAFLDKGEAGLDLCERACRSMFERHKALPEFGLIVVITQNPDFRLPHMSALLQDRLRLPSGTCCFDVGLGCSGYVYGLKLMEGFMQAQDINDALLVTCDPYSRIMDRSDRDTVTVFGDAAACTWITSSRSEGAGRIKSAVLGTDGSGARHLIVRSGGAAEPLTPSVCGQETRGSSDKEARLFMDGRAIMEFMLTKVPPLVDQCLQNNGLSREDIDYYVFHQASAYMLKQLARRMDLPVEKVPILIDTTANTVSSTLPIALDLLRKKADLRGKRLLLCGFGVGLSWGSVIIEF